MHFVYTADETNTYSRYATVARVYAFMIYSTTQDVIFIEDRITLMVTKSFLVYIFLCSYAYFKVDFFCHFFVFYNQNVDVLFVSLYQMCV